MSDLRALNYKITVKDYDSSFALIKKKYDILLNHMFGNLISIEALKIMQYKKNVNLKNLYIDFNSLSLQHYNMHAAKNTNINGKDYNIWTKDCVDPDTPLSDIINKFHNSFLKNELGIFKLSLSAINYRGELIYNSIFDQDNNDLLHKSIISLLDKNQESNKIELYLEAVTDIDSQDSEIEIDPVFLYIIN